MIPGDRAEGHDSEHMGPGPHCPPGAQRGTPSKRVQQQGREFRQSERDLQSRSTMLRPHSEHRGSWHPHQKLAPCCRGQTAGLRPAAQLSAVPLGPGPDPVLHPQRQHDGDAYWVPLPTLPRPWGSSPTAYQSCRGQAEAHRGCLHTEPGPPQGCLRGHTLQRAALPPEILAPNKR